MDYFAKKRECFEVVEKHVKQGGRDWLLTPPEQCYVPSMNTCICEYNPKNGSKYVSDVLTGKVLASDGPEFMSNETEEAASLRYLNERYQLFLRCAE